MSRKSRWVEGSGVFRPFAAVACVSIALGNFFGELLEHGQPPSMTDGKLSLSHRRRLDSGCYWPMKAYAN
jgi:hypothetical protein